MTDKVRMEKEIRDLPVINIIHSNSAKVANVPLSSDPK